MLDALKNKRSPVTSIASFRRSVRIKLSDTLYSSAVSNPMHVLLKGFRFMDFFFRCDSRLKVKNDL